MAAPAVTVYRPHQDENFPDMGTQPGKWLYRALKACLVDGYGDKPAAGWTMPFEEADEQHFALRNASQTGFLELTASSPTSNTMGIRVHDDMRSFTDTVNTWSYITAGPKATHGYANVYTGYLDVSTLVIVASKDFFYLCSFKGVGDYGGVLIAGKYHNFWGHEGVGNFICSGGTTSASANSAASQYWSLTRSYTGEMNRTSKDVLKIGHGVSFDGLGRSGRFSHHKYLTLQKELMFFQGPYFNFYEAGYDYAVVGGAVPGLFRSPQLPYSSQFKLQVLEALGLRHGDVVTLNGKEFISLYNGSSDTLFISLDPNDWVL